ncbi:PREDICTED: P2X purinoceptor 4 isoform X3 [Ficedula albicollis]|uniref:P2X purinoceptor 4 isoform X3 n=1 Tax=Ficedula albicollis TaxID=59894 RepID=UPI0007AD7FA3|nr:PREDICTED: P2X purinoceptor 4 isoform X3 [Ficedula albicollis]
MALCGALQSFLFEYDTPRIVLIRSRKVGLINRAVQLGILAYVIGWVFLWEKGYQETDAVVSSVTTKVKGVTLTNTSLLGARIWDVADYVIPPQGENTVFVMTNAILTLNQSQGRCPELPDDQTKCEVDNNCVPGYVSTHSSGIQTGKCVPYNSSIKTCEVFAWCPVEDDYHIPKPAFLREAENFTLLVKNNIWYRKFNFSKVESWHCRSTGTATWTEPLPTVCQNIPSGASTTRTLPTPSHLATTSVNHAAEFAKYYKNSDGTDSRTLVKAYGIRFDIMVFGKAGKFDVIPTMINIGSGLALFGVATVLCDIFVLYCMKKKYYYREKKYKYVEDYELGADET